MCLGGMGLRAEESSLEFDSILTVPGPMRFSRLMSPLQSVLNKYLATSYLPRRLKDNTYNIISLHCLTMEFSVLCSLRLAAEANARCFTAQPSQFMQHEDLSRGLVPESGLPWTISPRMELCPCGGGTELAGEKGGW